MYIADNCTSVFLGSSGNVTCSIVELSIFTKGFTLVGLYKMSIMYLQ